MSKKSDVIAGMDRIIDAALARFNDTCEVHGIEPDDPRLTGEDEENEEGAENTEGTEGTEGSETAATEQDGNVMPTPTDGASAELPTDADAVAAGGAEMPPAEGIPAEGTAELPTATTDGGAVPPAEGAEGAAPQLTPEEEEQLKAAQAAQQ